jgi:hypothetical protein
LYVAWRSNDIGDGDILFSKSTDGGTTFTSPVDLSVSPMNTDCPHMTVSGANIYIVWEEAIPSFFGFHVFFRSSFYGGVTFNPIKQLSKNEEDDETPSPRVAALGKKSYIAWIHDFPNPSKTFFKRTLDGGTTFSGTKNLVTDTKIDANGARVAVSGDTVYVVWDGQRESEQGSNSDIYMRVSKNSGKDFGHTKNLSNNAGDSTSAVIRASGNNVYVAWLDDTSGNSDVFFRRSTNMGDNFGGIRNLSNTSRDSFDVVISSFRINRLYRMDRGVHFG